MARIRTTQPGLDVVHGGETAKIGVGAVDPTIAWAKLRALTEGAALVRA